MLSKTQALSSFPFHYPQDICSFLHGGERETAVLRVTWRQFLAIDKHAVFSYFIREENVFQKLLRFPPRFLWPGLSHVYAFCKGGCGSSNICSLYCRSWLCQPFRKGRKWCLDRQPTVFANTVREILM